MTMLSLVLAAVAASAAEWISVPEAPVATEADRAAQRAADGTSCFVRQFANRARVEKAEWTTTALGVYEASVNGRRVGSSFLKPGFTHVRKTRRSFTDDVTALLDLRAGATNELSAEVSSGWWRDRIVNYAGRKSAFYGILRLHYADGSEESVVTEPRHWRACIGGPVTHAGVFDGEEFDARVRRPSPDEMGPAERNEEFRGEILPSAGGEVTLRMDLAMTKGPYSLGKGETLVVDFGQNCAAVPSFVFSARRGTVLTCLPGEMLNDADRGQRGCDGPKGGVYRANLRIPDTGMRLVYTFAGTDVETYLPRFTYFGYRYLSITASDDVEIASVTSIPVSSIRREMELGSIETGDAALNRFIRNVYWGQLSNYVSIPTDCPQRNERLGWSADTQAFCEAGTFNADTRDFFMKWTRDLRDSRCREGGYPSVAPYGQYGNETFNFGWADAGVIVPWTIWKQFGDVGILRENYAAMCQFVRKVAERKYDVEGQDDRSGRFDKMYLYADWLSFERFETCGNRFGNWKKWKNDPEAMEYRRYLAACFWLYDARLLAQMAAALGRDGDVREFTACAASAETYIRERFFETDGLLRRSMRDLQTACVFALYLNLVAGEAREATKQILLDSIAAHDGCLQTGFLGTAWILDALTETGAADAAYSLLLNHRHPSWLYSVDQGATTVWERWNSYTRKDGFGPVGMNSFNHYAYGSVLSWIYRVAAGIAADVREPGFRNIVMAPKPDRRMGHVKAGYRSPHGLIASEWHYEGADWVWNFTIPEGATADVTLPGETFSRRYAAGTYRRTVRLPADPPSKWPFIVLRQTSATDEKFLSEALELHAQMPGACDEIWFSASLPFGNDAAVAREMAQVERWRAACGKAGIRIAVQQGNTLGHGHPMRGVGTSETAPGLREGETLDFTEDAWMVGRDGRRMTWRRFCPTSPEVLEMTYRHVKKVLETLHPSSYWPDDDLRLGFYTDEGCFCPRCEKLTQEEQLTTYLGSFRRAADEVCPDVRFGLQTVRPHAKGTVENYRKMLETLSGAAGHPVGIRPGDGYYNEYTPRKMVEKTLGVAREAERCRTYGDLVGTVCYEEENFRRQALNKSPGAIVTECALALACGADTLSIYFAAGGESPDEMADYERFVRCLAKSRPYLERLSASTRRTHLGGVVAGAELALAGIPVSVPESPAAVAWPKDVEPCDTSAPTVRCRRAILDALDAATGGAFPVRTDLNHALRLVPRIGEDGRVESVTILNCSIGETGPFELRVRKPAGGTAELMAPREPAVPALLKPNGRETVVSLPSVGGYQIVTVFFAD